MTRPVACVAMSSTVEAAAEQMARGDRHHLVVVDGTGAAVGMLSTLDLLRALLELPARHPAAFPHWDPSTRTSWTDDWPLEAENARHAPDASGVLLLVTSRRGQRDAIVWVEACSNVRARVLAYASRSTHQEPALTRVLALDGLRFRASHVDDPATRDAIVRPFAVESGPPSAPRRHLTPWPGCGLHEQRNDLHLRPSLRLRSIVDGVRIARVCARLVRVLLGCRRGPAILPEMTARFFSFPKCVSLGPHGPAVAAVAPER